ncbi:hypothetical protein Cni_G25426 [Canna indica]|uniref:Uncharacterized protein n=1 Tax=Canna indica TaxID=4628 RepID=A0AAQ3KWY9_9LILI|nr:hypothetical protein Cni_G25426 [Canna indica]
MNKNAIAKLFAGKLHVKNICDQVFEEYASDKVMPLEKLPVAVLRVYNCMNKDLLGPHKEPPSQSTIEETMEKLRPADGINDEKFYNLILEWSGKDLRIYMAHKVILALLAAPSLALATKGAGRRAPRIGPVVEKIPTPVFVSVYSLGLLFVQR